MSTKIKDLLWIWGMKVNALQETTEYRRMPFGESSITVEQVIQQTGITNVYIAGNLPLTKETLQSIPSAKRIVCKTSAHKNENSKLTKDMNNVFEQFSNVKKLAEVDRRIEAFALDDFSTGSLEAGITEDDIARMCVMNAKSFPFLPTHATVYPMSLNDKKLPCMIKYFDQLLLPMWFIDDINHSDKYIDMLNSISGNKPILFALYVYDFGKNKFISNNEMQQQFDIVESLLHRGRITGCVLIGTCLFDIGLESVDCMYKWVAQAGDDKL